MSEVLESFGNPPRLGLEQREAVWGVAIAHYRTLLTQGVTGGRAARKIRAALFQQAPQLAPSVDAILKAFKRQVADVLSKGTPIDGRKKNGNRFKPPQSDVDLLRFSVFKKNGGRHDAAWREEYLHLSDYTLKRYGPSMHMPAAMRRLVNPEMTAALGDAEQGKQKLKARIGTITRKRDIPSMHQWVMDDLTATIECIDEQSGSLLSPQIVAVMDTASRKFVGWAISPIKAPTADLSCEAFENAIVRCGGEVPNVLGIENGFVFGRSLVINGKEDESGQTVVGGLGRYGCRVRHFNKMNPQSKGELEKGFDLLQRLFERHPGYAGRIQMLHASDDFKRQQREINRLKDHAQKILQAKKSRYTFPEFCEVIRRCFEEYNAAPRESLNGFSPNEVFEQRKDRKNPPIKWNPELLWMFRPYRYVKRVKAGGVVFSHLGQKTVVRGEPLPRFIGKDLRVMMKRGEPDLVTFMTLDYSETFTMEACKHVSEDERAMEPGSGVLAGEREKTSVHTSAIKDERNRLIETFGDTRKELLNKIRQRPVVGLNPAMVESFGLMEQQRAEIRARQEDEAVERKRLNRSAQKAGVHRSAVANAESLDNITKLLNDD